MNFSDFIDKAFNFNDYAQLLPLVSNSLIAGAVLGVVGGLIGIFIMMRDMAFAVHGIAELSFAGASFALLIGADVVTGSVFGSLIAALILGFLGTRARDRNSITGVLMPFGLGLGILFLSLYEGRSANKFGLLTGQIVAVDDVQLNGMLVLSLVVVLALILIWRPLTFASVDPVVANARGVRTSGLSIFFMVILALAVAVTIQVVGALLVLALLITPAAAAMRVTSNPVLTVVLSIAFAELAVVGGILLALAGALPISPYVTTISFMTYVVCRGIEYARSPRRRHQV
ncbi:metal ABC transporter permease [Glutamicibacter ectropisis]|uniref:Metal ABC transporter permease n=1 Tax=Glutamicibacter ectropisis TaxID=3046593 RepID=A0AAU6WHU5_9MICC